MLHTLITLRRKSGEFAGYVEWNASIDGKPELVEVDGVIYERRDPTTYTEIS